MIAYLLDVSLCWLIFYLLYYFWLSKETFFHLNRWYLLSTLLLGMLIPVLPSPFTSGGAENDWVTLYVAPITLGLESLQVTVTAPAEMERHFDWATLLRWVYWVGVIMMGIRFVSGLWRIGNLYRKAEHIRVGQFKVALTEEAHLPFSFFQVVFKSKLGALDAFAEEKITDHELAHVRGWHTIDVLLVELVSIFLWCSPLVYLYRRSLRIVHEYIADSAAIRSGQKKQYGHLLIRQSQSGLELALANHFIQSQLKKRIMMMTKTRSGRQAFLKYLPVIPLLIVAFMIFSNWKAVAGERLPELKPQPEDPHTEELSLEIVKALIATEEGRMALAEDRSTTNEAFDSREEAVLKTVLDHLRQGPVNAATEDYDPLVLRKKLSAILYKRQQLTENQDARLAMDFAALHDEWAARYPEHKNEISKIAVEVATQYELELSFADHKIAGAYFKKPFESLKQDTAERIIGSSEAGVKIGLSNEAGAPYVLLNDQPAPTDWEAQLDPNNIQSVTVLKGESAIAVYGDKAKDGAIEIYTKDFKEKKVEIRKQEAEQHPAGKVITRLEDSDEQPLYVVDGEIRENISLEEINPNDIEKIEVLKGESAIDQYGKKGEHGVVRIYTKTRMYDQPPTWKGCSEADKESQGTCSQRSFLKAVYENIRYPATARQQRIQGTVIVKYTIGKNGNVQKPEILKGIGGGCDEEVLRVISELPDWKPAIKDGKPVAVEMVLPVQYRLEGQVVTARSETGQDDEMIKKVADKYPATLGKPGEKVVVVGYGVTDSRQGTLKVVEDMPRFPGCEDETQEEARSFCSQKMMLEFIYKHITYPKNAKDAGIEGTVIASFVVTKTGQITDARIERGLGYGLNELVLAVLNKMPEWIPGKQNGQAVDVVYNLPVRFKLNEADKAKKEPTTVHVNGPETTPAATRLQLRNFKAAPNPSNGLINLQFQADAQALTLRIMSANGQVAYQREWPQFNGSFDEQINLQNAPKGTLFITIQQGDKVHSSTIILQ